MIFQKTPIDKTYNRDEQAIKMHTCTHKASEHIIRSLIFQKCKLNH